MKRGYRTPEKVDKLKQYGISALIAEPENVKVGKISKQQLVMKGHVFKKINFFEKLHYADRHSGGLVERTLQRPV